MNVDLDQVTGDPELAPLWTALYERLCSGADPASIATIRAPGLTSAGVATLRSWLDNTTRRRRGTSAVSTGSASATVPIRELLAVLGLGPDQLVVLAEQAVGHPVVNRAHAREQTSRQRQDLWAYAERELPKVPRLLARLRAAGVTDDEAAALRRLIPILATVLDRLPADPPISLAKLAHDCAGDPHYFDLTTRNGARLVSAVAELTSRPEATRPDIVRALLYDVGIIADRLSATVLLHRVRTIGDGPIDRRLRDSVYPVALTLLDLTRTPPTFTPGQILTVVENPSVLEAAMQTTNAGSLACTSGYLGSVDHALLQLAVDQNIPLRYAGDLDDQGLWIATYVARTYGAELIAMDASTVHDANATPSAVPLSPLPDLPDAGLKTVLGTHGHVLFQEHDAVLHRLFDHNE